MTKHELLKDAQFDEVTEARVDTKHRVALGKLVSSQVTSFRVYRNAHSQIILDPLISIPALEAWLFKNQRAATLVQRGLEDAQQGRLVKAQENFSKALHGAA